MSPTPCRSRRNRGNRSKLGQGRMSQPRSVPLSQFSTHPQGKGITANQVVLVSIPPSTHPPSRVPALPAMAYEAEEDSVEVNQTSPLFSILLILPYIVIRNPRQADSRQCLVPALSLPEPYERRALERPVCVLPDSHQQEMHSFPTCWQHTDSERSHSCWCGKPAGEKQFPSPEPLRKEKLNTYL